MTELLVRAVWWRRLTPGDFFAIERNVENAPQGGGGQTYIDVPNQSAALRFLGLPDLTGTARLAKTIDAAVVGSPDQIAPIVFEPRSSERYRICNQARQYAGAQRHPAWSGANGFPEAPDDVGSREDAAAVLTDEYRLYIVRTDDEKFFAGFVSGATLPDGWPDAMSTMFGHTTAGLISGGAGSAADVGSPIVGRILAAWGRGHNVLLYGPPGTGKTHAVASVWRLLEDPTIAPALGIDPDDGTKPFRSIPRALPMSQPVKRDWVTFHQNYEYEDFILGLRPVPTKAGLTLTPRMGRLLDLVVDLDPDIKTNDAASAVLVIDEINRGNVARIFGEFITFMDSEYRSSSPDGSMNSRRLPVPFPQLNSGGGETEPVTRPSGGEVRFPVPWYFPTQLYLLATMNSVDRAVAPLDSALGRRFERIDVGPDLVALARDLSVDVGLAERKLRGGSGGADDDTDTELTSEDAELTAPETAWLLLRRLNDNIASVLGSDFELGHSYLLGAMTFREIAARWDFSILPQLQERFQSRPDDLAELLKVDSGMAGYPFVRRSVIGQLIGDRTALQVSPLLDLDEQELAAAIRHLARS